MSAHDGVPGNCHDRTWTRAGTSLMNLLINLDVPHLGAAETAYAAAFGLHPARRFGGEVTEMLGGPVPFYLLHKPSGSVAVDDAARRYERHWMPMHLDMVVDDVDAALARAEAVGFRREGGVRDQIWGRIVQIADPWGHGWCLLQFVGRGYDAIADAAPVAPESPAPGRD